MTEAAQTLIMPTPPTPEQEAERIRAALPVDIQNVEVFGNRILVAKYVREKIGSIFTANQTQREDTFQGKVGLVIAKGPLAFKSDHANDFCGQDIQVGDWISYNYGDGSDLDAVVDNKRVGCKILKDVEVHAIVPRPDLFY